MGLIGERGAARAGEWDKAWAPRSRDGAVSYGRVRPKQNYMPHVVLKDDGVPGYGDIGDGALGRGTFTAE